VIQNRNTIIAHNEEVIVDKGKAINNIEENQVLHGDWLVVSRKKKAPNQHSLNASKIV